MLNDISHSEFETKQSGSGLEIPMDDRLTIFEADTTKVFGSVFIRYCIYTKDRQKIRTGAAELTFSHTGEALMPMEAHGPADIGNFATGDTYDVTLEVFRSGQTLTAFFLNDNPSEDRYVTYEVSSIRMPRDIAEKPMIQMTITGLASGQKWHGLSNGVHLLSPQNYTIQKHATAGGTNWNTELWEFGSNNLAPTVNSLHGKFHLRALMLNSAGAYNTHFDFRLFDNTGTVGTIASTVTIGSGTGTVSGDGGLLKDRALCFADGGFGMYFAWQRVRGQRPGIWGNY